MPSEIELSFYIVGRDGRKYGPMEIKAKENDYFEDVAKAAAKALKMKYNVPISSRVVITDTSFRGVPLRKNGEPKTVKEVLEEIRASTFYIVSEDVFG
mgnify:CR=1 FL=1